MEEQVDRLVNKVWDKHEEVPASKRYMVAIAGIPGSGKTTLALTLTTRLNSLHAQQSPATHTENPLATCIPLDGFHLSRAQLSALPDPTTAHARRGAPFTFDAAAYLALVRKIRSPICPETSTVCAPSFDHAVKDPVQDDIPIRACHRIVVLEGNYVALDKETWRDAAALMDEIWFVDVGFETARRRLVARHVKSGICGDEEEAGRRADENDLVNGREIVECRVDVQEVIRSVEDEAWKPEEGSGEAKVVEEDRRDSDEEMASFV